MLGYKKGNRKLLTGQIPLHYPGDRVYLDGDKTKSVQDKCARKADLTNLDLTGTTNTTGSTIPAGKFFYLNGTLVRAKTNIASGATFTLNTNYEVATVGGLNDIVGELTIDTIGGYVDVSSYTLSNPYIAPYDGYINLVNGSNETGRMYLKGSNHATSPSIEIGGTSGRFGLYVRKGMAISVYGENSGAYYLRLT